MSSGGGLGYLCILVGCLSGLVLSSGAGAGEITELTVTELVGAARTGEPIRMGIPLAKGVAKEVTELALAGPTLAERTNGQRSLNTSTSADSCARISPGGCSSLTNARIASRRVVYES